MNSQNNCYDNIPWVRLGDYIECSTRNNKNLQYGAELIEGVTSEGVFAKPKVDVRDVNLKPYKVVQNGAFVYNPSRLNLGSIAYREEGMCIVSHLYIIFYLNKKGKEKFVPKYLYMYFRRNEFYREVTFRNFGSQRPEYNFRDISEIFVPMPEYSTQQKFVDVYEAMVANQKCYENGLSDLKLTCDAYIEDLRRKMPCEKIGPYIEESTTRNSDNAISFVQGVNSDSVFGDSIANLTNVNLANYKVVCPGDFAYNPSRINVGSIAHRKDDDVKCIISPMYIVFRVKTDLLLPDYLMLWLQRKEFFRSTLFYALGSVRDTFDFKLMKEVQIPIPDIHVQQAIVDIYKCFLKRKEINERLKAQIKDLCPILIRGSLQEGGKTP